MSVIVSGDTATSPAGSARRAATSAAEAETLEALLTTWLSRLEDGRPA